MPPYYKIADYLWGSDANIDSDGNSESPESTEWDELTLMLRDDTEQRIDIDPIEGDGKHLLLRASNEQLQSKVVSYLKECGAAA